MSKQRYVVVIREVASQGFEVFAKSEEEAISRIRSRYEEGKISLDFDPSTDYDVTYEARENRD